MILCFDTYYFDDKAKTVCLAFEGWMSLDEIAVYSEILSGVEDYVPGQFYKRELPCILSLMKKIDNTNIEAIVIDGFVYLDDNNSLGLGGHLYDSLERKIPVIGVAKTNYASVENNKRTLFRGLSRNPLFISAVGLDVDKAVAQIRSMAGVYRIPTLLKKLDTLTKQKNCD
jgi:deoxyribonuclease V